MGETHLAELQSLGELFWATAFPRQPLNVSHLCLCVTEPGKEALHTLPKRLKLRPHRLLYNNIPSQTLLRTRQTNKTIVMVVLVICCNTA